MQITTLETVSAVIDALGGIQEVMKLTGRPYEAVWNWRDGGRIAAPTYLKLISALAEKGLVAPPSLWGLEKPGEPFTRKRRPRKQVAVS